MKVKWQKTHGASYQAGRHNAQNAPGFRKIHGIKSLEPRAKYTRTSLQIVKILVIPSDLTVLDLLYLERLPYILCYPQRSEKEAYRNRFAARGNTDNFIDVFIGKWNWFLDALENDQHSKHIVLGPNQFLSDVIRIGSTSSSSTGGWDIIA